MSAPICQFCKKPILAAGYTAPNGDVLHEECARELVAKLRSTTTRTKPTTADRIRAACDAVRDMLIAKNASYGDSALKPRKIFGTGNAVDLLRVRIDDKLSRIANAPDAFGEDAIQDLIGYLILLKLALEDQKQAPIMLNDPKNTVGYQGPDAMSVNYPCAGKTTAQIAREWDEQPQAQMPTGGGQR